MINGILFSIFVSLGKRFFNEMFVSFTDDQLDESIETVVFTNSQEVLATMSDRKSKL